MDRNIKSIQQGTVHPTDGIKEIPIILTDKHSKTYNAMRWVKITNRKEKGNLEGNQKHHAP